MFLLNDRARQAIAGSSAPWHTPWESATWRSGYAADCKSVYPGSNPGVASTPQWWHAVPRIPQVRCAIANSHSGGTPILNTEQREVVEHPDGPLLVLAGAGTGKTSALTARLAELLRSEHVRPWQVLAVTFTNKAAREMRERVAAQFGGDEALRPEWMGTFHSLSARILRRHAEMAGLQPDFAILDRDDSTRLLQEILRDLDVNQKLWSPKALAAWIDRWKNRAQGPADIPADEAGQFAEGKGLEVYKEYSKRLTRLNAADFGDLIMLVVRIFQQHPEVAENYRQKFEHILVDEYQDVNVAQYLWLRLIAKEGSNICCVGDDDQAIYGWRGAEVGHILRFERDFASARVIRLEQNYRSTQHILSVGASLLRANSARLGKTLWSDLGEGQKVRVCSFSDGQSEAKWVADEIESIAGRRERGRVPPAEIAILVRASFLMNALESQLAVSGIPYRVVGGPRFFDRMEVRDAVSYLQLAAFPHAFLSFSRVANRPRRGIGPVSVAAVRQTGQEQNLPVADAAYAALAQSKVRGRAGPELASLAGQIQGWQAACEAGEPPAKIAASILEESGYLAMWRNEKTPDSAGRVENLEEFLTTLERFDSVRAFLEHVALVNEDESDSGPERISLMTIHAAKGLEFDTVFLPGWEDETFPSPRSLEERRPHGLEEERRIAHVAVTRARKNVAITYAARRFAFGSFQYRTPSRFLTELPDASVHYLQDGFDTDIPSSSRLEAAAARSEQYLSPGWSRMQKNLSRASDGVAKLAGTRSLSRFKVQERVFHVKFGYGEVQRSDDKHVQVEFQTGVKTVLAAFLAPASRN